MQAVPNAEGQLIIAASPACAPRSQGSHRHLDAVLSIDLFAVLETGDGISSPLMSPVLSATRVPETHITDTDTEKKRTQPFAASCELFALVRLVTGTPAAMWMIGDSVRASFLSSNLHMPCWAYS